ncbi:MAG: hypothetical protein IPP45_09835 [Sphingomonadales bacterium]|nr:hypothetical protein [Sphingomonadales bacterium]
MTMQLVAQFERNSQRLPLYLALRCSRNGKLEAELLDQHQICCYELAFAASELFAAREVLRRTCRSRFGPCPSLSCTGLAVDGTRLTAIRIELNAIWTPQAFVVRLAI